VHSGVVVSYNADARKWKVQYDQGAPQTTEEFTLQQVTAYHRGTMHDEDGEEMRCTGTCCGSTYLQSATGGACAWYLQREVGTPLAIARWHAHARTNGGLASVYGRAGPMGWSHCPACEGMPGTAMHMYRHCPRYAAPRAHLTPAAICEWHSDATAGGARPTREDALRWIHDNSMADGNSAPLVGDDGRG
jgi:hypothetical protein